jgi:hypothetical protein
MTGVGGTTATASPPARTGDPHPHRRLVTTGLVATLTAVAATTLVAALTRAGGVDLRISGSTESVPPSGVAVVTGFFCVVGVALAAALRRWSARPAGRFLWTALALTVVSLVPPFLAAADAATAATLVSLHLVAAAVMVPVLVRVLRPDPVASRPA